MTLRLHGLVPLLLLTVASCHRGPPPAPARPSPVDEECYCPTPPRVERPPPRPGMVDVTGSWERVGSASTAAVTRCEPGYRYIPKGSDFADRSWTLAQRNAQIELAAESISVTRDGAVRSTTRRCETARGRLEGAAFALTGHECLQWPQELHVTQGMPPRPISPEGRARPRPLKYELTFEAETGHLVGSRNGAPIRLAPVTFVKQGQPCQEARSGRELPAVTGETWQVASSPGASAP